MVKGKTAEHFRPKTAGGALSALKVPAEAGQAANKGSPGLGAPLKIYIAEVPTCPARIRSKRLRSLQSI